MTELYKGSCHCGAIHFSYESEKITKGLRCNCSICSRKGAMVSFDAIPQADLKIDAEENSLGLYQFGDKTAKHYFCKKCGIYTFHESTRKPGHFRVNLGCINDLDTFSLKAELFDGKHLL